MRNLASVRGIKGVESVEAEAEYEPGLEAVLSAVRRAFISEYCFVVVVVNWLRAAPMLVVAAARLLK